MLVFAPLVLLAASVQASVLTLQAPRFTIFAKDKTQIRTETLSLKSQPSPLNVSSTDILKITFQVIETENEKGVQPHQTFLRFYDRVSGEEGIQPVRVTPGGKAKFELNMARPPTSLPPTTVGAPLYVSLIVGSFVHDPATFELFELYLPASHPPTVHPDEASFSPLPAIEHTFQPEQVLPPKVISAVFALTVLSPWVLLSMLLSHVNIRVPELASTSIIPFIALLGAFEALLVWYWAALRLGDVLFYGSVLGVVGIFTGRSALASVGDSRLGRK